MTEEKKDCEGSILVVGCVLYPYTAERRDVLCHKLVTSCGINICKIVGLFVQTSKAIED